MRSCGPVGDAHLLDHAAISSCTMIAETSSFSTTSEPRGRQAKIDRHGYEPAFAVPGNRPSTQLYSTGDPSPGVGRGRAERSQPAGRCSRGGRHGALDIPELFSGEDGRASPFAMVRTSCWAFNPPSDARSYHSCLPV